MPGNSPSLPRDEWNAGARRRAIELERDVWRFDHSWHGLTFPDPDSIFRSRQAALFGKVVWDPTLPEMLNFVLGAGWPWLSRSAGYAAWAGVNNAVARRLMAENQPPTSMFARLRRRLEVQNQRVTRWMWAPHSPDGRPRPWTERTPMQLLEYEQAFPLVPTPASLDRWSDDTYFAWQRLAGTSPVALRWLAPGELRQLRQRMPVTDAQYEAARPGDTLEAANADLRLFVIDYDVLDGIEAGQSFGWRKWLTAPIALFALTPDRSTLLPVAIQCGSQSGRQTPVFTPADGMAWQLAKTTFQVAESNYHGIVEHGVHCHIMMGAIAIALRRTLAPWHPVRLLLEPHLEGTIPIDIATKALFEPGGRTPTLQAVSARGVVDLVGRAWREFDWNEQSGDESFTYRGVLDRSVLPTYPMRDDITPYGPAIERFVERYLALYYASDDDVGADTELVDFLAELHAPEGADIPTINGREARLHTRSELTCLLRDMIWRAAPYHAVINYSIYEAMVYQPNMPTAAYAPPPAAGVTYELDDLLAMFPPREGCAGAVDDGLQVANLRLNRLGYYRRRQFRDPRVAPLIARFQRDLGAIADAVADANWHRLLPYTILEPPKVTASIHV